VVPARSPDAEKRAECGTFQKKRAHFVSKRAECGAFSVVGLIASFNYFSKLQVKKLIALRVCFFMGAEVPHSAHLLTICGLVFQNVPHSARFPARGERAGTTLGAFADKMSAFFLKRTTLGALSGIRGAGGRHTRRVYRHTDAGRNCWW